MNTATKTTFEVSNVHRATAPLPDISYKEAVEAQLTAGKPVRIHYGVSDRKHVPSAKSTRSIRFTPG